MYQDKKKIFIIDDDKFLLNMYAKKLVNSGFIVETAENASLALEKLQAGLSPDALIVDVNMPGMTGIELVKTVKEKRLASRAKIIMLTNESEAQGIDLTKKMGVDGYIIKATTIPSEVVSKLREIMTGKKIFSDAF
jgi:two-component system OmpR family response regulator